jgi:hypothetical protein
LAFIRLIPCLPTDPSQYGLHPLSRAHAPPPTPPGLSRILNRFLTAPSATDPSTTSPWGCVPCTGTTGSSSTTSTCTTTL